MGNLLKSEEDFLAQRNSKISSAENPKDFLAFAISLAKESSRILERIHKKAKIVKYKGKGDFALNADILVENNVIKKIRQKYPEHDILTEESGHHHKKSEYLWVIDPLEGTLNYAHNLPFWAVNIGLFYKGEPLIGVVYAPLLKELFYAAKGKGAYLNGKRIHVSKDTEIIKSFYAGSARQFSELKVSNHLLRALGCCGLEMAYVACGRFGARIKLRGTDPYGYGAGSILVLEAGGKLTDAHGKPWNLKSDGAIASNGLLHEKLLKIISNNS